MAGEKEVFIIEKITFQGEYRQPDTEIVGVLDATRKDAETYICSLSGSTKIEKSWNHFDFWSGDLYKTYYRAIPTKLIKE